MADVDLMRGLTALDDAIRESVMKDAAPGAGLYMLLDSLATSTLGVTRSAFPPPTDEATTAIAAEAQPTAEPTAAEREREHERHRHGRHS